MSTVLNFPLVLSEADRSRRESADELLEGLWTQFRAASDVFQRYPSRAAWQQLKQAHVVWRAAFLAEDLCRGADRGGEPEAS